jgi:hypothetical protein
VFGQYQMIRTQKNEVTWYQQPTLVLKPILTCLQIFGLILNYLNIKGLDEMGDKPL